MTNLRIPLVLMLSAAISAQAPIVLNGQVWDGNGGPLAPGAVYVVAGSGGSCGISVPAGQTLTIQPGAIVKLDGCFLVGGTLDAVGTQSAPIVFTSIHDDTVGGDTNNNGGATSPAAGDWGMNDWGGDVTCKWSRFHYGGAANGAAFTMRGQPHVFEDCNFEDLSWNAIVDAAELRMERCHFEDLGGIPIVDLALRNIDRFRDNTAVRCGRGEYVRIVHMQNFLGNLVMDARHSFNGNGVFVLDTTLGANLPAGATWTLPAGTVFKFSRGTVRSSGAIIAQGTPQAPVVMTSLEDDAYGGDTEKDGAATQPAPGDWGGIDLAPGDSSALQHFVVRYGGRGNGDNIEIAQSSAVLTNCRVEQSAGSGVMFRGQASPPARLVDCEFDGNAALPVANISWLELAGSSGCVATNNGAGDHFQVAPERPSIAIEIVPDCFPGDVLTVTNRTVMNSGGSLRLPAGTILKFLTPHASGFTMSAGNSGLFLDGTARRPVVLTSFKDDAFGGDTNLDGNATQPAPGDWQILWIGSNAGAAKLENTRLRYGRSGTVICKSALTALRQVRVAHSQGDGFQLDNAQHPVQNCVAFDCGGDGFRLQGGAFDLTHATAAGCTTSGIIRTGGWNGVVRNSCAWGNGTNVSAVPLGQMFFSNGDHAGQNGNLVQDPLFVSLALGDLHLGTGSPCLGAAELGPAVAVGRDHEERSRVSDHALTGVALPDMGAFEGAAFSMAVTGEAELGATMGFTLGGPAGFGTFLIGFPAPPLFVNPLGIYLAGPPSVQLFGAPLATGGTAIFSIPNDAGFVGVQLAVQGVGLAQGAGFVGSFTAVERLKIHQ